MRSKIMAKCVFGLHRRGRIACPPFSKRGQKMIRFRWFFGPVVEVASKVCPKGVKGMPQFPPYLRCVADGLESGDFFLFFEV